MEVYCFGNFCTSMQLSDEEKSCMFEENLTQRYKDLVPVHMKPTFRQVVDGALIGKRNWLVAQ